MRNVLTIYGLLLLAGCAIPVVGNSPEEIKHRHYTARCPECETEFTAAPVSDMIQGGRVVTNGVVETHMLKFKCEHGHEFTTTAEVTRKVYPAIPVEP